jgi:hypothetical protein
MLNIITKALARLAEFFSIKASKRPWQSGDGMRLPLIADGSTVLRCVKITFSCEIVKFFIGLDRFWATKNIVHFGVKNC